MSFDRKSYMKKYNEENKGVRKEYTKKWREENKEARKKWDKKYREKNKESIKKYRKKYYGENKETKKEYTKKYQRTLEGKYTCLKATAKSRALEVQITFEEYMGLVKENKCYYCDASLADTTGSSLNRIDSNKGYSIANVRPCCGICNVIMNNFTKEELLARLHKIAQRLD